MACRLPVVVRARRPVARRPVSRPADHPAAVIVLTAYDYPAVCGGRTPAGAAGFVLKTAPLSDLVDAIRRVAEGGLAFSARPRRASSDADADAK